MSCINWTSNELNEACFAIVHFSNIVDNAHMWITIINKLPEILFLCVKYDKKAFYLSLGTKLGIEIRDMTVPEELQLLLNELHKSVNSDEDVEETDEYWFYKSLFNTIESFKVGKKKKEEKYELLIIVEGPSEFEVLPVIFDRFYPEKLPNWKKRIAIFPLEGISKIKQLTTSEGIELSKLAEKTIVLIDSDKKELKSDMPEVNKEIISKVSEKGGTTFILRKRELENYVHPAALKRVFPLFNWDITKGLFDDFNKVKYIIKDEIDKTNRNKKGPYTKILGKIFSEMTTDEFNAAQEVILPNGERQLDFDTLVAKIMEALFS